MGSRSSPAVMLVIVLQAGCASHVQAGLANAPVLGGDTVEARVHDATANGKDSCERSGFPEGGVLRGQMPPCVAERAPATASPVGPPPGPAVAFPPGCPDVWPDPMDDEKAMTGRSRFPSQRLVCRGPW